MVEPCEYVCNAIMILKLLFLPFPFISSRDSAKESRFSEEEDDSEEEDEKTRAMMETREIKTKGQLTQIILLGGKGLLRG